MVDGLILSEQSKEELIRIILEQDKRIKELEIALAGAVVIPDDALPTDEVAIGSSVDLKDTESGEAFTYFLVSAEEADIAQNKISLTSPVGASLLGKKVGALVEVKVPAGVLKYKVLKISR